MPRPIPRHRLTQSVVYRKFDESGRDNSYDEPVTLKFVRYEENSRLIRDQNGNILKGTTLLIYDNVTSSPRGLIFREQDKVTINVGQPNEKTLKVVAPSGAHGLRDHHQEVILQ